MTREIYEEMMHCLPSMLDAITIKLQLNDAFLPGQSEPIATRAAAIYKLVEQRNNGFTELERALDEVCVRRSPPKRTDLTSPTGSGINTKEDIKLVGRDINDLNEHGRELRVIRIFLASSEEMREDRDAFELYFRQQNDQFRKEGFYLEITRWENFLDAMSETRLQDEYNKEVRNCDIFVSLFSTKTGKFTEEEFDAAHQQFIEVKRPKIYTFFKNVDININSVKPDDLKSLWAFQEKLKSLGHYYTSYNNIEHLKRQFRDQLDKLLR